MRFYLWINYYYYFSPLEVQVVHEVMPSPEEVALAKKYQLPETFYLYKNKPDCPGCIGCEDYVAATKSNAYSLPFPIKYPVLNIFCTIEIALSVFKIKNNT